MFALWDKDSWLPLNFCMFCLFAWLPLSFACYACWAWWDITAWLPQTFAWLLPVLSMAATLVCHPVVWGEGEGTIHHSTTLLFNYFSLKAFCIYETISPFLGLVLGKYTPLILWDFPRPWEISRVLRRIFQPNTSLLSAVYGYNTSRLELVYGHSLINNLSLGMYQELHPLSAISIDSVKINTSLKA